MEEQYMLLIWNVFSLKVNENLTNKEKQDKIIKILSSMKEEAKDSARVLFKRECLKEIQTTLDNM